MSPRTEKANPKGVTRKMQHLAQAQIPVFHPGCSHPIRPMTAQGISDKTSPVKPARFRFAIDSPPHYPANSRNLLAICGPLPSSSCLRSLRRSG